MAERTFISGYYMIWSTIDVARGCSVGAPALPRVVKKIF